MTFSATNIDKLCIDTVRCLAMDAVQKANSGHPGTPMAQAPAAYVLWTRFLKHNPADPAWVDRDRFVLSCGHVSMLIYSLLHLSGYDLSLEDLKQFRQWGSRTPGHPEFGHTPGVETTTGPLGQGIGNAVGMAIAERWLADRFNRPGHKVVDHRTFAFAGDGDVMEGVGQEAASLAGHLGLEKLVLLYDNNRITIEGRTDLAFTEDVARRFEAQGWRVLKVADGEDLAALTKAFQEACRPCGKPTLIDCRTIIGFPAPTKQNTHQAHGAPLGEAEVRATKEILGWDPDGHFVVPAEALAEWRRCGTRGEQAETAWRRLFEAYRAEHPQLAAEYEAMMKGGLPTGWDAQLPAFNPGDKLATREAGGKALNALAGVIPNLVGGSADLAPSTLTDIKDGGNFQAGSPGRNFHWGVREHAMGAVLNGMSLHGGLHVFGATFFIFSDYMRPSVRLAALMRQPVKYVWTHDSIGVGEDGPTHQPVEQLMSLRMVPNLTVIRPADANETVEAWRMAMAHTTGPVGLALTRQKLPALDPAKAKGAARGAYILEEASAKPRVILMASGSEVHLALAARAALEGEGIPARVVSMPCWEVFQAQPASYREEVLPAAVKARVSVEAGVTFGWERWIGDAGASVGLDHFGASAPAEVLFKQFGFTVENVVATARKVLQG
ncbi:MAG: transketolase [Holophaga sp.]